MEDANKQPQSFGNGQQRGSHPRPYFYVQPPSQPYYLYQQWQLNNPYSHYGLPSGFNFARPCIPPYQYMHYPGFVFPHAPIYPVDYRRMFEPRFHSPTWGDMPRPQQQQQQQHHTQSHGRPEMACSEAQTDPSDTITKLIECLDKFRAGELQGADRELDSGVASQSSGIFSPVEEKKTEEQGHILPSAPHESHLESQAVTFSDSTMAVYDGESSQRSLDMLSPQVCWSGGLEEEDLPLDSSSIHEECPELEQPAVDNCLLPLGKDEVTDIQTDVSVAEASDPKSEDKESTPSLAVSSSHTECSEAKSGDKVSKTEHPLASLDEAKAEVNFQILKLPFDSVLSPAAESLSTQSAPYYCNYLPMQTTHERMSVLSPSLDELSSREEMFSTDLDDMDFYPKHVYADRRLAEAIGSSPQPAEEIEEVWLPGLKRFVCACCGKSLAKRTSRGRVHSPKMYQGDAGDSEEEGRYGRGCEQPVRVVVRKHAAPRKTYPLPQRRPTKLWHKGEQYKEQSDPVEQEDGRDDCKQEAAEGEAAEVDGSGLQCRTCQDRHTSDRSRWTDDVIPRWRKAGPLQRQETSPQWKVIYHRPRDDDDDNEPPTQAHWERDMETATSTLQASFGLGPRGPGSPHGAQQSHQGPHQPAPGPSGAARPEEQHHKPFFYMHPSQSYVPMQSMQWPVAVPMPVSYNPYYGYPGLGYGMPLMPHYQANPYMEPPGFIVPHTHLHLTDYRRMLNPQYYQTMAYHARRFRYQHNSSSREMATTEVQTEPLVATERTRTPSSSDAESSGLFPDHSSSGNTPSIPTNNPLSPALAVQKGGHPPELKDMAATSTTRTPSNGGFVIQTEEVRIECCTTPVGLQMLHAHETAEVSHSFSQDMVQCSSILQSRVLQDDTLCLPADQSEQALQVCPDILLVGTPSTGDKIPALEESRNQMDTVSSSVGSPEAVCSKTVETGSEKDISMANKDLLKVIQLPFDPKYLDELRKMEATVWSVEETLIPSPVSLITNDLGESHDETLTDVAEDSMEMLLVRDHVPAKEMIPVTEMPPLAEDDLEDMVPAVEGDEKVSEEYINTMADVSEEARMIELTHTAELSSPKLVMLESSPLKADGIQHRQKMSVQDHQDTSFESLPAYLPSASWLSDFDNVYCYGNTPAGPKKPNRPLINHSLDVPTRRRKLELEYKEQPHIRKPKERYKPKGKADRQSLSDHECCISRNFNENIFSPYVSKRERLCSRCLAKRRICTSASPGLDGRNYKRKAVPFQQWNDTLLPTCEACKPHTKGRLMRKGSNPDVRGPHHGHDTEGESSENGSYRAKWRGADDHRRFSDLKRPLASKQNLEKFPPATYTKSREKNCMCSEHQPVAWERLHHCPHGNTIREMDENCAVPMALQDKWKNVDKMYPTRRWQTGKPWKDAGSDADSFKSEARSQYFNKHKKPQPQSQGTRRKDTRC